MNIENQANENIQGLFYRQGQQGSEVIPVLKSTKSPNPTENDPSADLIQKLMKNSNGKIETEARDLIHKLKKGKYADIEFSN